MQNTIEPLIWKRIWQFACAFRNPFYALYNRDGMIKSSEIAIQIVQESQNTQDSHPGK